MESAVIFAPLRPAGFVNFMGQGGAGRPSLVGTRGVSKNYRVGDDGHCTL